MLFTLRRLAVGAVVLGMISGAAQAHFLWLVPTSAENGERQVHVYFSESAEPGEPELIENIKGAAVQRFAAGQEPQKLETTVGDAALVAPIESASEENSIYTLDHTYGVIDRGNGPILLKYYAKSGPSADNNAWSEIDTSKSLPLDLQPQLTDSGVSVVVRWQGEPLADAEYYLLGDGVNGEEGKTDAKGVLTFPVAGPGLYSIRVRHIEAAAGELDGKKYSDTRHYSTLALNVGDAPAKTTKTEKMAKASPFAAMTEGLTSFGGTILDGKLYLYGGHLGSAHSYSTAEQSGKLVALDLKNGGEWQTVSEGPKLQGLALVAHGNKLYRIGGFSAHNAEGEKHDLWSSAEVASFDPATKEWTEMPSLPEPRSSFDAVVVGSKLYVIGGWALQGSDENKWHDTAYVMDLDEANPTWTALPSPPFQRRALSVAAHDGRIYAIGGMGEDGPSTRVDVFDPQNGTWVEVAALQGEPIEGFGCSAWSADGDLFVSTIRGRLQRLSKDGRTWEVDRELEEPRFFHRMLPLGPHELVLVGGADMETGKRLELEVVDVR